MPKKNSFAENMKNCILQKKVGSILSRTSLTHPSSPMERCQNKRIKIYRVDIESDQTNIFLFSVVDWF